MVGFYHLFPNRARYLCNNGITGLPDLLTSHPQVFDEDFACDMQIITTLIKLQIPSIMGVKSSKFCILPLSNWLHLLTLIKPPMSAIISSISCGKFIFYHVVWEKS